MGYILPITQYEYINYQTRDIKEEKQTEHVGKSYKVILRAKQDKLNNDEYKAGLLNKQHDFKIHKKNTSNNINAMHYAIMTGKGGIINEVV